MISAFTVGQAVVRRFREDEGFLLAAALSYALLLCVAPLLLIFFSVAGFLLRSDATAEYFVDSVLLLFPAYGAQVAEFLSVLTKERAVTGLLGAGGLVVFVTQLFSMLRTVMNRAFRVPRRRLVRGFVLDLAAVTLLAALVGAVAVSLLAVGTLGDLAGRLLATSPDAPLHVRRSIFSALAYLGGLGALFAVYRTLPNARVRRRAALTATLTVGALWDVVRLGFTAYVRAFGVYGKLYGSFGIGVAGLIWIYYSAIIFVIGAELAAVITAELAPGTPPAEVSHAAIPS